jgi:hypothetical protein
VARFALIVFALTVLALTATASADDFATKNGTVYCELAGNTLTCVPYSQIHSALAHAYVLKPHGRVRRRWIRGDPPEFAGLYKLDYGRWYGMGGDFATIGRDPTTANCIATHRSFRCANLDHHGWAMGSKRVRVY